MTDRLPAALLEGQGIGSACTATGYRACEGRVAAREGPYIGSSGSIRSWGRHRGSPGYVSSALDSAQIDHSLELDLGRPELGEEKNDGFGGEEGLAAGS